LQQKENLEKGEINMVLWEHLHCLKDNIEMEKINSESEPLNDVYECPKCHTKIRLNFVEDYDET
jgi:hypothetical protein